MAMRRDKVIEILDILDKAYPTAECALGFDTPFQLLIAVVLSAQATDVSVNKVTPVLFAKYKDAYQLASADENEVQQILKKIGMYRTKAKNIINLSKKLVSDYHGQVPESDSELTKLAGVGRKTANVVMSVAFGHQRIAVDTHVFRVSNRIGIVDENDVLKTELALMKKIPENRWTKTHHLLIFHGRHCCTARKPKCEQCPIEGKCRKVFKQ